MKLATMKPYTLPDGSTIEVDTKSKPRGYLLVRKSRTVQTGKTIGKVKRSASPWYPSLEQLLKGWAETRPLCLPGTLPDNLMQAVGELRAVIRDLSAALSEPQEAERFGQSKGRHTGRKPALKKAA